MTRRLILAATARRDLDSLLRGLEQRAGYEVASGYVSRVERFLQGLVDFPERGTRRSKHRPKMRVIGFERRVSVVFTVDGGDVVVLRVLYGGRNLPPDLS
ncbi:type II toxin-antitoxin system RelE/ParE family toxin [Salinarimonas chemoclinalis]|uniref:type II toxin-antitoxin system RelE/ParE family toxin n=1 Tax=Salinarimonas chemoclinalis TaxID=3241599 RepID=UPI003557FC44